MRLAAVQYDIAWEDKDANWSAIGRLLAEAGLPRESLAVLPEMADTGFSMDASKAAAGDSLARAQKAAHAAGLWLVAGYAAAPALSGTAGTGATLPSNAASVISPQGTVAGTYRKVHLFSPTREAQHYRAGASLTIVPVASGGETWQVCPLICYDLRFPELFRIAALAGAEVFVVGANWPATRAHHWRALAIARAIENQAFVVACNRVGSDPMTTYAGGSIIVAPDGEIMAEAHGHESVISAEVERSALLRWRDRFPALRDARRSLIGEVAIERAPIH